MEIGSQESDLCDQELIAEIMGDPELNMVTQSIDFSSIAVPPGVQSNEHVDIAAQPSQTGPLPITTSWEGDHVFRAEVDFTGTHKKSYVLSPKLNKIFVDMEKVVPIKFFWDGKPGLFVRGLMVFTQADNQKNAVKRCVTHRDVKHTSNSGFPHVNHVLASNNHNAVYEQDSISDRCSVVVPLGELHQGSNFVQIQYKFMCKTSCPGGLNRALTDVIFTLEDIERNVLGRQKISVKICSCPKRDKEKEEEAMGDPHGKKRKPKDKAPQLPAKKIKLETDDEEDVSFMVTVKGHKKAEVAKQHLMELGLFNAPVNPQTGQPISSITINENFAYYHPFSGTNWNLSYD